MKQWEQLITVDEVIQGSLDSTDAPTDEPIEARRAIQDVTQMIAEHLGFKPIVHKHTQGIEPWAWTRDEAEADQTVRTWADVRPIVQITSPTDIDARFDGYQFTTSGRPGTAEKVVYFAGWKRKKQALSDLPTGTGEALDGLTETPEDLPSDIRRAALELTLYVLNKAESPVGMGSRSTTVQGGNITIDGPDPQFVNRTLRSLDTHRRTRI